MHLDADQRTADFLAVREVGRNAYAEVNRLSLEHVGRLTDPRCDLAARASFVHLRLKPTTVT
jgi:hypothetical protein